MRSRYAPPAKARTPKRRSLLLHPLAVHSVEEALIPVRGAALLAGSPEGGNVKPAVSRFVFYGMGESSTYEELQGMEKNNSKIMIRGLPVVWGYGNTGIQEYRNEGAGEAFRLARIS